MASDFFLGLDFGTSGARACVIAPDDSIETLERVDFGAWHDYEIAGIWRETLWELLARLPISLRRRLSALAIDATSATVLAGRPSPALSRHPSRRRGSADRPRRGAGESSRCAEFRTGEGALAANPLGSGPRR
jgi:ribulose kinase